MTTFYYWLIEEKEMSIRSAKDVISRIKRVKKITSSSEINESTLEKLKSNDLFLELSMFIKSQLKRAVMLSLEFQEYKEQ